MSRLRRLLAGEDGPGRRALPLGEFLHPVPLAALVLLALNDHVFKGSGLLPSWLTGKLSDFAGLLFFPLLLTALADTLTLGLVRVAGLRCDFTLRRWKLVAACLLSAAVFIPLELSPAYGRFYTETLGRLGFPSATTPDLLDLTALVMLPMAYLLGRAELRRLPLGRLEWLTRHAPADPSALAAHIRAGLAELAPAATRDALADALTTHLTAPTPSTSARVDTLLRTLRA